MEFVSQFFTVLEAGSSPSLYKVHQLHCWYLVTVQLLGNFLEQQYFNPLKLRNGSTLLWFPLLSSDTWIQRLPFLQKRSAHTRCRMCPDFSTALVMSLSTGLSSTNFTVSSPSSRCATSRVCHDVTLLSTHIDGQRCAGKMFKTCNLNHKTGKHAFLLNLPFYFKLETLQTLILTVLVVERAPEQAYPSKVWFFNLSFSGWAPHWAPVKRGNLKPSVIKKSKSLVLI